MLSGSLLRFLLQAGFLILVATIAAGLHLDAWVIVVVMGGAFAAVVVAEWFMTRKAGAPAFPKAAAPGTPGREAPPAREPVRLRPRPAPAAAAAALFGPVKPAPIPPRAARPRAPASPPRPPAGQRRRWNVFDLQNRASGIATTDPARQEEFTFLLLYLRELADVAGDLSEEFDEFVRESFPELVAAA
ncbi:MAG TPA: hypothetical protein VLK53_06430 [Gaiellaceae bacterium]|nr:hypothetical protein [Gaiellaceae bacterium]